MTTVLVGALFIVTPSIAKDCCSDTCWDYGVNPPICSTLCDLSVSLDFLILKTDLDKFSAYYSVLGANTITSSQKGAALVGNAPDWDWGFQIGVGKGWDCIPYEFNLSWMHFQTDHSSRPQFDRVSQFLIIPSGDIFSSTTSAPALFEMDLHFNQISFDISREVLVGPNFFLQPALGLDYVDYRHHSSVSTQNVVPFSSDQLTTTLSQALSSLIETFRTQIRAFGPSFSLTSGFAMDCGLRIDVGLKGALLWAETRFDAITDQVAGPPKPLVEELTFQYNHHTLHPELIYSLNLTWMDEFSCMGPTFTLHAGWQGLFLFGVEETVFHIVEGKTFNLQGFLFGAQVTF